MYSDEEKFLIKNFKTIKNFIETTDDPISLLNDQKFINLLDSLIPDSEVIKKHILSNAFFMNNNYRCSQWINTLKSQIKVIRSKYNKIALYGNGNTTTVLRHLFEDQVEVIFDKSENEGAIHPDNLIRTHFDCIVVMVLGREDEIKKDLINTYGVAQDKIVTFEL